jgi:hypothetical protein
LKWILGELGFMGMHCINLAQGRNQCQAFGAQ